MNKNNVVEKRISYLKRKITVAIDKKMYNEAILLISTVANILYKYNQEYMDIELEKQIKYIGEKVKEPIITKQKGNKGISKRVIFYDGFGLDIRGLALIYIRALLAEGYRVCYLVDEVRVKEIPLIKEELSSSSAKLSIIPKKCTGISRYKFILDQINKWDTVTAFLYTYPADVTAIMAYNELSGEVTRYLINLTDHAFWLGINAFDYCIEFRDYGASISHKYRNISKEKIIVQPYYPVIDSNTDFQGYPFERGRDDFIVFSGGNIYKTVDEKEHLYYKLVRELLDLYKNIKFWYAGTGSYSEMDKLIEDYPKRVYYTEERKDLFQVLQNCDMYLNTYPLLGGLMTQYAAKAGIVPLSIDIGEAVEGLLINQNELNIFFENKELLKKEFKQLFDDSDYRAKKGKELQGAVISEEDFNENLCKIIESQQSKYIHKMYDVKTEKFREKYSDRFDVREIEKEVGMPYNLCCIRIIPFFYAYSLFFHFFRGNGYKKIWKRICRYGNGKK